MRPPTNGFDVQVLDVMGFVGCGRAACRISVLRWTMGKETAGKKLEDPHSLKSDEMVHFASTDQRVATPCLKWKIGKETGGNKLDGFHSLR